MQHFVDYLDRAGPNTRKVMAAKVIRMDRGGKCGVKTAGHYGGVSPLPMGFPMTLRMSNHIPVDQDAVGSVAGCLFSL